MICSTEEEEEDDDYDTGISAEELILIMILKWQLPCDEILNTLITCDFSIIEYFW